MKIKYDTRIIRRIFIAAVLSTVIVVSGWLAGLVPIKDTHGFEEYLLLLTVVLFWPMVILWVSYIDGKLYLRNLKTAGFEVPADRRKYENKLANLPRFKELVIENTGRNKGSLLLIFFACLGAVIFLLILTDYVWKWGFLSGIGFMIFSLGLLVFFWMIGTFVYFRQSDNRKYRNFYEPEDARKVRTMFGKGMFTIIIALCISLVLATLPFTMTEYVARTIVESDKDRIYFALKQIEEICAANACSPEDEIFQKEFKEYSDYEDLEDMENSLRAKNAKLKIDLIGGKAVASYSYTWEYRKIRTEEITYENRNVN